jgi:hypothetical protein
MPDMPPKESPETCEFDGKLTRREFARRAALAAATAIVVPPALLSQETASRPAPTSGPPPQSSPPLSPELQAEGELKYQWIIQNYGGRLTEAEKKDVHRLVMEGQKPLAAFRAFPLDNSDQPVTVLKFTDVEMSATRSQG